MTADVCRFGLSGQRGVTTLAFWSHIKGHLRLLAS